MTSEEIVELAKQDHYVNNLVCGKQIWGLKYRIGVLCSDSGEKKYISSIKDLINLGFCKGEKFLVIDQYWENLELL